MKPIMLTALLCGGSALSPAVVQAQDHLLTLHHSLSPTSAAHVTFPQPWADRIFEQSEGQLLVEIYPSMAMGGEPTDLYDQVRNGMADLVWTPIGSTPGAFPRSEVFELPFVHRNSAEATNQAIQDIYDAYLAPDFADVRAILVHVHAGQAFHTIGRPVHALADLAGLTLQAPSRTAAWAIAAMGAEPVEMPASDLPQALAKDMIDGALMPFELAATLDVQALTNYSIEGPDRLRFGTTVFVLAMNPASYDALPDDMKAVIDANSGSAIAAEIGAVWDANEVPAMEATTASGSQLITLDEAAIGEFEEAIAPVQQRWVDEVSASGIDGAALLQAAKGAVAAHGN